MSILRIILLLFRALFRDRSQLTLENLALLSLARVWDEWRSALVLVKPETVLRWHRQGFRYFWRWKSRGRPCLSPELMVEATVAKYMARRHRRPPSQTWRTFLRNHLRTTAACDFFVVPTATFRLLFCFVILSHDRRRIVHFNVTDHPTAVWAAEQIREAFPGDGAEPRYLLRDRGGAYGDAFRRVVRAIGIREVLTAHQSPWQNPHFERVIGSIRRE